MKRAIQTLMLLLLFVAGAKAQDNPLTFEAIVGGTVTFEKVGDFSPNDGLQYRLGETGDWTSYSYGTGIPLQAGQKLQFRSTSSDAYSADLDHYCHFTCTANCYLYGNIASLINEASTLPHYAFCKMFLDNTHIKKHTGKSLLLPATTVAFHCYDRMFSGCTALTLAPELPATTLNSYCYDHMFSGCTSLTTAPTLPATYLTISCYAYMFSGCTSLTSVSNLPDSFLVYQCYDHMFSGCTSLTTAPALPSTLLAINCYESMFSGCTSLITAPTLPATTLTTGCYSQMFKGCTNLSYVKCLATDVSPYDCTTQWLDGVAAEGIFFKAPEMEDWTTGDNGIPEGWTVTDFDSYSTPLTFEAIENDTRFIINNPIRLTIQYSTDNGATWTSTNIEQLVIAGLNAGATVCLRGDNDHYFSSTSEITSIFCNKNFYVYGNMMSLVHSTDFATATTLTRSDTFRSLFTNNKQLMSHPIKDLVLPATSLSVNCYMDLFSGCTGLTAAPALPAIVLYMNCYESMFSGCTSLTAAPALPAIALDMNCYKSMFSGCTSLTAAPALPAISLDMNCYESMFSGCTSLTEAPALPATTLADSCYRKMFMSCASLTKTPVLPATTLTADCYYQMFKDCTSLNYVVCYATDVSQHNCTFEWLSNVAATGAFVPASEMGEWTRGDSGLPFGWTISDFDYSTPLTLEATQSGTTITIKNPLGLTIEYSTNDGVTWAASNANPISISINAGQKVCLRGDNASYANDVDGFTGISCNKNCYVYGNVMSLVDSNGFVSVTTLTGGYNFAGLFTKRNSNGDWQDNTTILNHPTKDIALPATTLSHHCYSCMFHGCQGLTRAPALPATALQTACYESMFSDCSGLTTAPALPALTLAESCYESMFDGCTSLTTAPVLSAPKLPSLCYSNMFKGCTRLNYVKCLAINKFATDCTDEWLDGVATKGTFVKALGMEDWSTGISGIPEGWTTEEVFVPRYAPLTMEATQNETTITITNPLGLTIEYSTDDGATWTASNANPISIGINAGQKVCLRGDNASYANDMNNFTGIACNKNCYVYGNVMSLVDSDGFETATALTGGYNFAGLFIKRNSNGNWQNNTTILNHPTKDIALPAMTLAESCYSYMFNGCQGLTRAPALPAMVLQTACYESMFGDCSGLTTAPALPAMTLAGSCYSYMFDGCTSLTTAPALPAMILAGSCYSYMFYGCTSLTTVSILPAMTLAESCYSKMFSYCTSLTTAPILPAMTLATNCYESMFYGCTSLTTVPTLPAMTLATNCYKSMFYGCSSLTTAPTLPALGLANSCYEQMFYSCTQLNYVKCLANDRDLINDGLTTGGWLHGVAPTGTFVKLNGAEWSIPGADGIPEGWDVENADVFTFIGDGGSGPWFDGSSWSNYEMPAEGSDVIIQAQAFIDGGTAIAGDVYLYGGGITIEESGQFIHTNSVKVTLQKWTTGFGNNSSAKNGWYTIASPFTESFTPSEDMLSGVYDLYYYDEAHAKWCNYKQEGDHYHFNIEPRKGYLYANSDPQNLSFTGWTPATNATFAVPLSYTATAGNLKGFNLVGNPFSCNVTGNVALGGEALTMYYIVDGGSELYAAALSERAIKPCEGFFVQATGADQQLVFNPATTRRETPAQPAYIRIEAGNDSFMDRAYVQFDSGNTLRKMSLCDDTPKVYVMHDGKDYAAATIGRDAPWQVSTLPVHFEAAENGTYTINVNVENVDLDYLHLVDNMTGADVDLLASDGGDAINRVSTYRFEAKTTDYASRFKLVFSLGDADEDNDGDNGEPFAYYNGSEWVIANGENATLQVVDVMGCIVICRDAARHVSTNGLAPGVYVLRLIDGESVRTQKIVVE